MAAAETPRSAHPSRRQEPGDADAAAETTTSQGPTGAQQAPRAAPRAATPRRGRPRVSNTATERVTLRVERENIQVIDTLVKLKQFSNRSDAVRHAIKLFCDAQLENVEEMVAKQEKRQRLLQLAALTEELDELSEQ